MHLIAEHIKVFLKYLFVFFIAMFLSNNAFAQQDSVSADSSEIYKNIETFAKRGRFTSFMYSLVFRPASAVSQKKHTQREVYKNLIKKPYSTFEGKIIRNIDIFTLAMLC